MVLSNEDCGEWLDRDWLAALDRPVETDADLDWIFESNSVSMRYSVLTQLLGKHANRGRDALCLQLGDPNSAAEFGRWDPRSFCAAVVVPWVQRTDNVLGTSQDPYVSKPLRRPRLDDWSVSVRSRADWERIVALLNDVQVRDEPEFTEQVLRRCLASIARHYRKSSIPYAVPTRVSIADTLRVIGAFLEAPSGGERPMIVAASLMRVLGRSLNLFSEVRRQAVNEADAASGAPGDILCLRETESGEAELVLAIEVKDREVSLVEVNATIEKARRSQITEVMFATPGRQALDDQEIEQRIADEWALGTNVYEVRLIDIARVALTLVGEAERPALLREIGTEINEHALHPSLRKTWADLLATL